jgi:hypothetical protein
MGVPEKVKVTKLMKVESLVAFRRKKVVVKWKDEKDVTLVSTFYGDHMVHVQTRKGDVVKPSVVINYNKETGSDYLHALCLGQELAEQYYMKIFCHLMDMCALDAYHMPRKLGGKRK